MKPNAFTLGLFFLSLSIACDAKEECIADCGETPTDSNGEDSSDTAAPLCQDFTDQADAFIDANRACETLLDCVGVDGICYGGGAPSPCGQIAVSANADLSAWALIQEGMAESCECGAALCGSGIMCNAEQQCESTFGAPDFCDNVTRDVETFLAANRSCETDDDCVALDSSCHVDACSVVAVNVGTNPEDWARLDPLLGECQSDGPPGEWCNYVGECGAAVRCGDEGLCIAEF